MQKHVAITYQKHKNYKREVIFTLISIVLSVATIGWILSIQNTIKASSESVYISEFMADSNAVHDIDGEWIELKNPTSSNVDLDGWSIQDSIGRESVITDLVISSKQTVVLCRNANFEQNGGVVCDYEWSSLILRNSDGSVSLHDETGETISLVEYKANEVVSGKSLINDGSGELRLETHRQYGDGDYGTPGNRTQIRVTTRLDLDRNGTLSWQGHEPRMPDSGIRIYNQSWEEVPFGHNDTNEIKTTGRPYKWSGKFVVDSKDYFVCSVSIDDHYQSYARTIKSYAYYPELNVETNQSQSSTIDEDENCIAVNLDEGERTSLMFGQARDEQTEIRVHAVIDENNSGQVESDYNRQPGWDVRLYNTSGDDWDYVETVQTTGESWNRSARLFVEPGEYALCGVIKSGYEFSFGATGEGWEYITNETPNLSGDKTETQNCIPILAADDDLSTHTFGYKPIDL